jgi:hypothetical protein
VSCANILILVSNHFPPSSPGNLIPFISKFNKISWIKENVKTLGVQISWIKENVKTLGVHHGYNVDNDKIWKDITI